MKRFFAGLSLLPFLFACTSQTPSSTVEESSEEPIILIEETFQTDLPDEVASYPASTGRTFYISNSGDDSNDGLSIQKPFKSLSAANKLSLVAGDSILLARGEEFTGQLRFDKVAGTEDNPITIGAYGEGERPIIRSNVNAVSFYSSSNIVVAGLHIIVSGPDRYQMPDFCYTGIYFDYSYVGEKKYENIYICDNEVEGTGVNSNVMGIVIQSLESTMATTPSEVLTGCYITGNEVHNLGRSAIHCGGWLRDEDINQNSGNQQLFRDFHFDGNHAYDTGCMGIYICASSDSSINRNIVHDTGIYQKNQLLEGVCGIMALCADHCEIAYNECYDIYDAKTTYDAMGIDIDWNTNAIDVHHNYCHDCMGSGIGTMANQNSFIRENRIIENRGETLHIAPITITNFTQYYAGVKDDMHAVKNLLIANNLVRNAHQVEAMMAVKGNNGSPAFEGDAAIGNHFVYEGDPNDLFFIEVDPSLPWYKFAKNQYFSKDTSVYKNLETTEEDYINTEEGAEPYVLSKKKDFAAWQKRDLGSSYGLFGASEKTKLSDLKVAYQEGEISASWADETASWRYAIFLTEAEKEATFPDLLDYSYEKSFSFSLERKGDYDLHIVPEDNEGNYGTPVQARLHLQ